VVCVCVCVCVCVYGSVCSVCMCVVYMGTWCQLGKQMPTCLVSFSDVEVVVELKVPQPHSVRLGQLSCGLIVLPQEDFPHKGSST